MNFIKSWNKWSYNIDFNVVAKFHFLIKRYFSLYIFCDSHLMTGIYLYKLFHRYEPFIIFIHLIPLFDVKLIRPHACRQVVKLRYLKNFYLIPKSTLPRILIKIAATV